MRGEVEKWSPSAEKWIVRCYVDNVRRKFRQSHMKPLKYLVAENLRLLETSVQKSLEHQRLRGDPREKVPGVRRASLSSGEQESLEEDDETEEQKAKKKKDADKAKIRKDLIMGILHDREEVFSGKKDKDAADFDHAANFQKGEKVMVVGLRNKAMNNQVRRIDEWDTDLDRFRLMPDPNGNEFALSKKNLVPFFDVGERVWMHSLTVLSQYNGTTGVVHRWFLDMERFEVYCETDGEMHYMKGYNLARYHNPPEDAQLENMNLQDETDSEDDIHNRRAVAGMDDAFDTHFQKLMMHDEDFRFAHADTISRKFASILAPPATKTASEAKQVEITMCMSICLCLYMSMDGPPHEAKK